MKKINSKLIIALAFTISTIIIVALLITNIVFGLKGETNPVVIILFIVFTIVSLFVYGLVILQIYKTRLDTVNSLISSLNSIESTQEEIFGTGVIIFNDEQTVSYISDWMIEEGFESFLGKNISKLNIDTETTKRQEYIFAQRKWEVVVSRKNRTILFSDVTERESLKKFVLEQNNAVLSTHVSFSRKLSFNEAAKSQVTVTILQTLQAWASKVKGLYTTSNSAENTSLIVFRWQLGKKDILNQDLLEQVKNDLGKLSNDVTISMGITYGKTEISELQEKSLRSLELSKSRGGDQIVFEEPTGEIQYIGSSSVQAATSTALNVKKYYTQLQIDLSNAREVFITAHRFADLDALGSALGVYDLIKDVIKETYIVLDEFDTTTTEMYNFLPKSITDRIISEKQALTMKTNRSYIILTDISRIEGTQAAKLLEGVPTDKISIIDHHRAGDHISEFDDERVTIETSVSSASEIVTEMLKLKYSQEAQSAIDSNVSTAMLAGIQLDTKQLSKNVSNSTFEAVSFLLNNDADQDFVHSLFRPSQDLLKVEANALKNVQRPNKDVIFTFVDEDITVKDEETSIIADKLLEYDEVQASFVLAKTIDNRFKLSARSSDKINVQLICESLGGGGHFNVAAASWKTNIQYSTVKKRAIAAINKGTKGTK